MIHAVLLALLMVALVAVPAAAQTAAPLADSTIIGTPPTPLDLAQYAFTLVLGVVTPLLFQLLERVAPFLRRLNATATRAVVSLIPGVISLGIAAAKERYPWIPLDPTVVSASVASAIAFAVYAGDKAKEVKTEVRNATEPLR